MGADKLFPTRLSAIVFFAYIFLFVAYGILINASKVTSGYAYNTVTVVLLAELLKFFIVFFAYVQQKSWKCFKEELLLNLPVLLLYFIPSGLYCLYNNLAFVNLARFDPTTYFVFLQIRVVITGVIYQVVFRRYLNGLQWISLVLLTSGCVVKEIGRQMAVGDSSFTFHFDTGLLFLLVQVLCSCFAGVYNEFLMKDKGRNIHVLMQNVFMYIDSIMCNLALLLIKGDALNAFQVTQLKAILKSPLVISIIVVISLAGIVTSYFLRELNSIVKNFASAIELVLTAIVGWLVLGVPIDQFTVVAMLLISLSTVIYAKQPLIVRPRDKLTAEVDSEC